MSNTLKQQAMKRLLTIGLMLASAFALTNCTEQVQLPYVDNDLIVDEVTNQENPEEEFSIPFEVYATSDAETKTTNSGNDTEWAANDRISVYHAPSKNPNSFSKHAEFTIRDVQEGLFGGALTSELSASNNWYFLYPYSSTLDNPADAQVTIGAFKNEDGSYNYVQRQTGADNKAHIQGDAYPMYGSQTNVPMANSPRVKMRHLSALVAIKIVNESGNPISIDHLELESAVNPIVGNMYFDLTGTTPSIQTNNGSKTATLELYKIMNERGVEIANSSEAKFYMAVAPVTDKFTIRVNGTAIANDISIPLKAGKITTLKVTIPSLQGTQYFRTRKSDGTEFITWNEEKTESKTVKINGQEGVEIKTVSDGTITISGTFDKFIGSSADNCALPLSFYAASKHSDSTPAELKIKSMHVYCHLTASVWYLFGTYNLDKVLDKTFTGEALSEKIGNLPISFSLEPIGDFSNNNVIILKEVDSYYYLSEEKANGLIGNYLKKEGVEFVIQDIRDAIYKNKDNAWTNLIAAMQKLAPAQFGEDQALGALLGFLEIPVVGGYIRSKVLDDIKAATLDVVLETTGDAICWGLNVQSPDTDISKQNN